MGNRQHFDEPGSSLFYETMRLIDIAKPKAVFFENVPQVMSEMPEIREQLVVKRKYELRWCIVSAAGVGAPHTRDRWFCLATRPGFALSVKNLRHTRFDWTKEPPRITSQVPQASVCLRCFALGNAVVPECVRKAFFYLVSCGHKHDPAATSLEYSPQPLTVARSTSGIVRFGYVDKTNTLHHMPAPPAMPQKPLRLTLDPALFPQPSQISWGQRHPCLTAPVTLSSWSTPRAGNTIASRVLTERSQRDLPVQVRFEKGTKNRQWPLSPQWVEWLMGYSPDWTKA
jgi:hypothetical protein